MLLYGHGGAAYETEDSPFEYGRTSAFYKTVDKAGTTVCAKVFRELDPREIPQNKLDEFLREIVVRQQNRLDHPNILPILDYGVQDAYPFHAFLILPFCQERDLRRRMRDGQHIPLEEAILFLRQIAAALDFAHQKGVVHGDIKPENILFKGYPIPALLTDFGAARWVAVRARISAPQGLPAGTPIYVSPEELQGDNQTPASDVYSFGIVAYEVLTGRLPFDLNQPPYKQLESRITGTICDARDANPVLSDVAAEALSCALDVAPRKRPRTASQFCDMLVGRVPRVDREVSMPESRSTPVWFPKAGLSFALLTTLFFMALVSLSIFNKMPPPQARSLIALTASLSAAFAFTFLGADASARGHVPLPLAKDHPIAFSAGGGVAVFVIVFALIAWLFPATATT
jgi:serine/threonine protein kinase